MTKPETKLDGLYTLLINGKVMCKNFTYIEAAARMEQLMHFNNAVTIQRQK